MSATSRLLYHLS